MEINSIIDSMQGEGIESLIIFKSANITYLSGFSPSSMSVIVIDDDALLYTSKMDMEDASNRSHIPVTEFVSLDNIINNLKGPVGIEKTLPVSIYKKICNQHDTKLTDIIETKRMLKSTDEIKYIQKAIDIAEESLLNIEICGIENEVAANLEYQLKSHGSIKPAFETIIASGTRSSMPHATISSNNLLSPVMIDWGAVYNSYCSDLTRTFIENEEQSEILSIVLESQKEAIKVIKPGIKASYVDKVARGVIGEYGYGKNFIHSTGHGIGIEIHENPTLSVNSNFKLQKGMVITVEPGIYIKDKFGIRIEDDILIKNKAKVLTKLKKDMTLNIN
ncbi:MAG: aminopeptidase P family protein [Methanobacterium sp.]|nr:aminopeptidase P family protein [Methanobacterium sp.]